MDTEPIIPASPESNDLQEQVRWLQKQIKVLLVLAIIISGTVGLFLLRQWNYARNDLTRLRPVVAKYQAENAPIHNRFMQNLQDYGRTHPEFMPLLSRYGLGPTNTAAGQMPAR